MASLGEWWNGVQLSMSDMVDYQEMVHKKERMDVMQRYTCRYWQIGREDGSWVGDGLPLDTMGDHTFTSLTHLPPQSSDFDSDNENAAYFAQASLSQQTLIHTHQHIFSFSYGVMRLE